MQKWKQLEGGRSKCFVTQVYVVTCPELRGIPLFPAPPLLPPSLSFLLACCLTGTDGILSISCLSQSQGCKLDTVLPSESGEGDGREKIASTPHSLKQQGERQATETARDENSSDLLGGRPRSSPVRIPGAAATAKMPRNSSSSQLHVHHGERDAGGGCSSRHTGAGAGEPVWDPAVRTLQRSTLLPLPLPVSPSAFPCKSIPSS